MKELNWKTGIQTTWKESISDTFTKFCFSFNYLSRPKNVLQTKFHKVVDFYQGFFIIIFFTVITDTIITISIKNYNNFYNNFRYTIITDTV